MTEDGRMMRPHDDIDHALPFICSVINRIALATPGKTYFDDGDANECVLLKGRSR